MSPVADQVPHEAAYFPDSHQALWISFLLDLPTQKVEGTHRAKGLRMLSFSAAVLSL